MRYEFSEKHSQQNIIQRDLLTACPLVHFLEISAEVASYYLKHQLNLFSFSKPGAVSPF